MPKISKGKRVPCHECATKMNIIEVSPSFILGHCPQCQASTINGESDWRTAAKKGISCLDCGEAMDRIDSRDGSTYITYEECPNCRASNSSIETCG